MRTTAPKFVHLRTSPRTPYSMSATVVACGRRVDRFAQSDDVAEVTCPKCRDKVSRAHDAAVARAVLRGDDPAAIVNPFDACLTNPAPRRVPFRDVATGAAFRTVDSDGVVRSSTLRKVDESNAGVEGYTASTIRFPGDQPCEIVATTAPADEPPVHTSNPSPESLARVAAFHARERQEQYLQVGARLRGEARRLDQLAKSTLAATIAATGLQPSTNPTPGDGVLVNRVEDDAATIAYYVRELHEILARLQNAEQRVVSEAAGVTL